MRPENVDGLARSVRTMIAEAKLAYQFNPGSYTASAYAWALDVRKRLEAPDWVECYEEISQV